jgi:hypothetical protein
VSNGVRSRNLNNEVAWAPVGLLRHTKERYQITHKVDSLLHSLFVGQRVSFAKQLKGSCSNLSYVIVYLINVHRCDITQILHSQYYVLLSSLPPLFQWISISNKALPVGAINNAERAMRRSTRFTFCFNLHLFRVSTTAMILSRQRIQHLSSL